MIVKRSEEEVQQQAKLASNIIDGDIKGDFDRAEIVHWTILWMVGEYDDPPLER